MYLKLQIIPNLDKPEDYIYVSLVPMKNSHDSLREAVNQARDYIIDRLVADSLNREFDRDNSIYWQRVKAAG